MSSIHRPFLFLLSFAGAVLLGAAGKLWLIHNEGSDLPYMDQWSAEGQQVLLPAAKGELTAADLVWPHNEHRVLWTRLLTLGLVEANGQWDAKLGMVVNTFIHAAAIALALALVSRFAGTACAWFGALAAAACIGIPFSWENTLASFQSQFYLWLFFSIPATWLMLAGPALGRAWWFGFGLGALCMGTMGSGFFPFAAAGAVVVGGVLTGDRRSPRDFIALLVSAGMCVAGWLLINHVPGHDALRADGVIQFLHACANQLAFPAIDHPWLAPLIQAPVAIWLWKRGQFGATEKARGPITGLILLALLSIAAIAYSRGGALQGKDPRYGDLQALLFLLNAMLLVIMLTEGATKSSFRGALASAWCVAVLIGFSARIDEALSQHLPALHSARNAETINIANFLRDRDPAAITQAPEGGISFPFREQLVTLLAEPAIAGLMPSSVRPDVRVEMDRTQGKLFSEGKPVSLPPEGRSWHAETGGEARFVSKPLPASAAGVLRFKVAGDLGTAAFPFHLRSLSTGLTSAPTVDAPAGQRWKTVNIVRPADPVVIEAGPSKPGAWGAFTEPVELGLLSWYASKVAKGWWIFAVCGAASFVVAAIFAMMPVSRRETFSLKEDGSVVLSSSN